MPICTALAALALSLPICDPPQRAPVRTYREAALPPLDESRSSTSEKSCPAIAPFEVGIGCYRRPVGQFERDPDIPMVAVTEECLDRPLAPDSPIATVEQPKCKLRVKKIKVLPPT